MPPMIYVDADACPVKEEVYRVAKRHGFRVTLVANSWMRIPDHDWLRLEVVNDGFDAADDWIVEQAQANDIVITGDIPLASRSLEKGAWVLGHTGRPFTEASIGEALATREFLSQLRENNLITGGPPPFEKKDRSQFLQKLDDLCRKAAQQGSRPPAP